jgi:hypothetical protein
MSGAASVSEFGSARPGPLIGNATAMRKIRNPRYAPEFLERKLSPSALVGHLATVLVSYPSSTPVTIQAMDAPTDPPNDPMPTQPSGPVVPA